MEASNVETARRNVSVSPEQKRLLIEFIKRNVMLISGKFSAEFSQKDSQHLWEELTNILNSCPGATKDWKSWRKTWQDIRSRSKVKHTKLRSHHEGTGGGGQEIEVLTPFELEVLDIIKAVSVDGHKDISESEVDFLVNTTDESGPPISSVATSSRTIAKNEGEMETKDVLKNGGNPKRKLDLQASTLPSVKCKPPRKKLLNAAQASETYRISLEKKNDLKKNYYEKKIVLLERMAIAKEKSAAAKEQLAGNISKLADILQEFL